MKHTLPELGYAYDALEPFIDTHTMEIHHTKHHQTYVDKLNGALEGHDQLQKLSVDQLVRNLLEMPESIRGAVRNHGGGHLNHSLFWSLLKKNVVPRGAAIDAITHKFGSFDKFKADFSKAATLLFGSGWTWLAVNKGALEIVTTSNQDNPVSQGSIPILGIDVWEHAYYLKYQNRRPDYVAAFFEILNWERVDELYRKVTG